MNLIKNSAGVLKRKESVLNKIRKVKGKLDLVLAIRDKKKEMRQEITEFNKMKPLVVFKEGKKYFFKFFSKFFYLFFRGRR